MSERSYELRKRGRLLGMLAGCAVISIFSSLLTDLSGALDAFQRGYFPEFWLISSFATFLSGFLPFCIGTAIVWWWLSFMGWRSRWAFALAGAVNFTFLLAMRFAAHAVYAQ